MGWPQHHCNGLTDTTFINLADGDVLRYNGSNWVNDPINLATDTVGNYVQNLVAGTGVSISNNSGEAATPTISIGQAVGTTDNVQFNNVTVSGNLTVSGTTTSVNTTTLNVADNIITLNSDVTTGAPTENAGIEVLRGSSSTVSIRWNETTDKWQYTNDGTTFQDLGSGSGGGTSITVSDTPPVSPTVGSLWFESDTAKTFIYYDSAWIELNGGTLSSTFISDTPPANPTVGTLWYETDSGALFVYYDSQWIETGGSSSYNEIIGTIQAKGDLLAGNGSQSLTRLGVGSNGRKLAADSTQATGLAWVDDSQNYVVQAKGDILIGATPNIMSRLPVSSTNGAVLVSDSTATNGLSWQTQGVNVRNLLYNGAMQIHQRATSVTGLTTSGYRTADRWFNAISSAGTWTQTVETHTSPTDDIVLRQGFRKSLKMQCTTADVSLAASDAVDIRQMLEGQDLQAIRKGTANAQSLTLSFWVKSGKTGTYICEFYDNDNNRSISRSYTINAAGTWEYKTITVPPDLTGMFDNDNLESFDMFFWLAAGSNYTSGTLNSTSWATTVAANRAVGQVNLADGTSTSVNYWQITGVELNIGTIDAPFEFKSYERELRECLRYFWAKPSSQTAITSMQISGFGTYAVVPINVLNPVPMRAVPNPTTNPAFPLASFPPYIADNNSNLRTITAYGIYGGGAGVQFTYDSTALSNGAIYFGNWGDANRSLWLSAEL